MFKSCCFSHLSYLHTTPPQRVFFERDHESPSRREKKTNGCAYHFLAFAQKEVVDRNAFLSVRSEIIPKGSSIKNESATCLFKKSLVRHFLPHMKLQHQSYMIQGVSNFVVVPYWRNDWVQQIVERILFFNFCINILRFFKVKCTNCGNAKLIKKSLAKRAFNHDFY